VIDLDELKRTWGDEFDRTDTHEGLNALARLAKAMHEDGKLPDEAYKVVCGWGRGRREKLNHKAAARAGEGA